MPDRKKSVLFVCLGNICRSPIAEAVFLEILKEKGKKDEWIVDSAGVIGYHTGKCPDSRTTSTLKKNGVFDYSHKARVVFPVMDASNQKRFRCQRLIFVILILFLAWMIPISRKLVFDINTINFRDLREIERLAGDASKAKLHLLGEFDPKKHRIVPDPYYEDGDEMFQQVFDQCRRCCEAFLATNS